MEPSFDTWTSLFLLAVAMGLFLFFILVSSRIKKNLPIAFLILAFSVILFQYVLYWTQYQTKFPYLIILPPVCYYTTGPLLYLYFLSLYKKRVQFNYALHFLPAFVLLIPNIILWLKHLGLTTISIPFMALVTNPWLIVGHMTAYLLLILLLVYKNGGLSTQYGKLRRHWAHVLIILYGLFVVAYLSYYVLVRFPFFNSEWDYAISIMMSFGIYAIGYFTMKQPSVFDGELFANVFLPNPNKEDTFETALLNEFYENLIAFMKSKKPYIDNELRLVNLADHVGYSTHLLSKVINKKYGGNFNSFVNDYRLIEAETLLAKKDETSIKSIYFDVGFNNKATFYKAFKMKHQCTPLQYQSRM